MENKYDEIIKKLEEYEIYIINPKIKEIFNAREHEILMAKEEEGFEKGEIIKVLNKGYKTKEDIILRANVVCSK